MNNEQLKNEIEQLKMIKENLQKEIILLDDKITLEEFGLFEPVFDFDFSDEYKNKLNEIIEQEKAMIKKGKACIYSIKWKLNGSEKEGLKLIEENCKQVLAFFNSQCDLLIDKVKFNTYERVKEKIYKLYETSNKLNKINTVEISPEYLRLKFLELNVMHSYKKQKNLEKEERLRLLAEKRENEKVQKEIEEKREEYEISISKFQTRLSQIISQINDNDNELIYEELIIKKEYIENKIEEINKDLIELKKREMDHRIGYVYIISNIGSFGENIFKIGMTRRQDPYDRINELSGASVPFKFDVHAMIFSEDAPKLESTLHKMFEHKKVNLVNGRKEFFNVTLEEIKQVVHDNFDGTVLFIEKAEAEQFRESIKLRQK